MSTIPPPPNAISVGKFPLPTMSPRRIPITRDMYHFAFDAGFISEKCELVDGYIDDLPPINQPHVAANDKGFETLLAVFGGGYVRHSAPLVVGNNDEPMSDLAITTAHRSTYIGKDNPSAREARLVVEVSDITLRYDLDTKAIVYAQEDIPEYWVASVSERRLYVHRYLMNGAYPAPQELTDTQTVSPLAAPNSLISVKDLLP